MIGAIKNIVDFAFGILFLSITTIGVQETYSFFRNEVIRQRKKGLSSMQSFTQQMTCVRYDEKLREIPIMTGHCGKYHRKMRRRAGK